MKRPTLIWDLDGTLLDSYGAILEGIEETYEQFGIPFEQEEVREFILRYSVQELLVRDAAIHGLDSDQLNRVRAASLREKQTAISLMKGAREIVSWAKEQGIQQFVYTHKSDHAFAVLTDLGMASYFTEIVTSDAGFARKPAPDALLYLINTHKLDRKQTYYVGDRLLDVEAALAAGIGSINLQIDGVAGNQKIDTLEEIQEIVG